MTTYRKLEEIIIDHEGHDTGIEEKQPVKDNRDVDEEDKKSITESNVKVEKKCNTENAKKEERSVAEEKDETIAAGGNKTAAATIPTPLSQSYYKVTKGMIKQGICSYS